jgi:hypothetical protein
MKMGKSYNGRRIDHRAVSAAGVPLSSEVFALDGEPNAASNAIGYAKHSSRSHDAVIRVYDEAGNVIETHEHEGEFKEW